MTFKIVRNKVLKYNTNKTTQYHSEKHLNIDKIQQKEQNC